MQKVIHQTRRRFQINPQETFPRKAAPMATFVTELAITTSNLAEKSIVV
jgi:hypothetical protein